MGAKLIPLAAAFLLLCGCAQQTMYVPYALQEDGSCRYPSKGYTSHQVLEYCEGTTDKLTHTELNFYDGSLYALSNYRAWLMSNGFVETAKTQSATILDSMLTNAGDRVRLIYQSTGTIRIITENPEGLAHILLGAI